jgi:hypothetical protein
VPLLRVVLLALIVAVAASCGGGPPSSRATAAPESATTPADAPGGSAEPATSEEPTTGEATAEPVPSDEPVATEEPVATDEPTASEEPTASDAPVTAGGADACTGSADNRTFLEGIARAADWPVLCGVLPGGWFVAQGSYRLANGGKLLISYKGPGGATIALSQGAFCTSADGCVPDGSEVGAAALGPLDATLYQTADGFAMVAAPGENPSWLMTTTGLDQASTVSLAAALVEVGK